MAESWRHYEDLAPVEAMDLLLEAAQSFDPAVLGALRLKVDRGAFGLGVTLMVPEASATQPGEKSLDGLLAERYGALTARPPRREFSAEGSLPLVTGIAALFPTDPGGDEASPPLDSAGEVLLLASNVAIGRAAEIFESLRFHATSVKVSAATHKNGRMFLFHVKDDPQRRSSFRSAVAGEGFADCALLHAVQTEEGTAFLAPEPPLSLQVLNRFSALFRTAPALFGLAPGKQGELLFALFPAFDDGTDQPRSLELLSLAGLAFYRQIELAPRAARYATLDVAGLETSKESLLALRSAIGKAKPRVGYRLELREVRHTDPVDAERMRLRERQAELEYQLAYLDSIAQPRPLLLRFSQNRLAALAELLRACSIEVIRQGAIQYGFHAHAEEPGGFHYLLLDPKDANWDSFDPLTLWDEPAERQVRFWLDPFWARYYHGKGNECLVFVPEGTALFPPMHDWDDREMDYTMRRTVQRWFGTRAGVPEIPERPIYLFEGRTHPKARLGISILNGKNLQPLKTRLGWLNDNLALMDEVGTEPFLQDLAGDLTRSALASELKRRAEGALGEFEETALHVGRAISGKVAELSGILDEELERVARETYETTNEIRKREQDLRSFRLLQKDMGKITEATATQLEATMDHANKLAVELRQLEVRLRQGMEARTRAGARVLAEIQELRELHDTLKQQFHKLLRLN